MKLPADFVIGSGAQSIYDGGKLAWSDPGVAVGDVWSRSGLDAYYNAGKVGIGTKNPISKLHVISGPGDLLMKSWARKWR